MSMERWRAISFTDDVPILNYHQKSLNYERLNFLYPYKGLLEEKTGTRSAAA